MSHPTSFDPRIVVRPRSLDQTLDLALAYVRIGLKDFVPLFAWLAGISLGIGGILSYAFGFTPRQSVAILLIVGQISERAVTIFGGRHLFGHGLPIHRAAAQAFRHLPIAFAAAVTANLPFILMLLENDDFETGLFPMGFMLATFWPFLLASHLYLREVLSLEHLTIGPALRRARTLVQFRFDRALALLAVSFFVRAATATLAFTTARFVIEFILQFSRVPWSLYLWVAAAGWILAGQFLALAKLFEYVDARTRREGWDIQIRFDAIKQRDEAAHARRMTA